MILLNQINGKAHTVTIDLPVIWKGVEGFMLKRHEFFSVLLVLALMLTVFGFGTIQAMGAIASPSLIVPRTQTQAPPLIPAAPSELKAGAFPGVVTVSLDWQDNSFNESGFTIERSIDNGAFSILTTVAADVTTYNDFDVTKGEYYKYRVCAVSGTVKSSYSNEAEWVTMANAVSLQGGVDPINATIRVSWYDGNDHELEYYLNKTSQSPSQTVIQTIKLPADTYYYDDVEVSPHVNYSYQVYAVNPMSGIGPTSNKITLSFLARPTNMVVSSFPGSSQLAVQWKNVEPSSSGIVLEKALNNDPTVTIINLPPGTTQYNDQVLVDTHYMYRVKSVFGSESTPYSEVGHWYSPPRAPIDFIGHAESSTEAHLTWQDLAKYESMYKIWREGDNMFAPIDLPAGSTSYIDKGLKPNTTYKYTIHAWTDSKTVSNDVPTVTITTPAGSANSNLIPIIPGFITNLTPAANLSNGTQSTTPMTLQNPTGVKLQAVLRIGSPRMMLNGAEQDIDPGQGSAPVIMEGRTLVPIRAIIEAMNGTVEWDGTESRVTINCNGQKVELWIGSLQTRVNGEDRVTDAAPRIINGRTMLPVRFISENLGLDVQWDDVTQQVTIQSEK